MGSIQPGPRPAAVSGPGEQGARKTCCLAGVSSVSVKERVGRHAMTSAGGAGLGEGISRGFLAPYAEIFAIPRAWRFSLAGIIARMPMSMYGLGTVLLISSVTGHYGLAGSVSAAGALGGAVCAPQLGRLVDRLG